MAKLTVKKLRFADVPGWADDDHAAALQVFLASVGKMTDPRWAGLDRAVHDPEAFFAEHFTPVAMDDGVPPKFTGYFEPIYDAAPSAQGSFRFPIYALPEECVPDQPFLTRAEIDAGALADRQLEIAWLQDPWYVFFLQVQGSGRLQFPDGSVLRVGYAGKNNHPYTSLGQRLVTSGAIAADQISPDAIRAWAKAQPDQGRAMMMENESYVFFRPLTEVPADAGPLGTLQVPLTAGRSIAVDPDFVPLGVPVWIELAGAPGCLMVAQDTGSAVKGAQRADLFMGTGAEAGQRAGSLHATGRMITLLPHAMAEAICDA
ncbi:MAG: MltA domain-containing protein [Pseudomonadota bacterium]